MDDQRRSLFYLILLLAHAGVGGKAVGNASPWAAENQIAATDPWPKYWLRWKAYHGSGYPSQQSLNRIRTKSMVDVLQVWQTMLSLVRTQQGFSAGKHMILRPQFLETNGTELPEQLWPPDRQISAGSIPAHAPTVSSNAPQPIDDTVPRSYVPGIHIYGLQL